MEIPDHTIASAAACYAIFAFDEGTTEEIRKAKVSFNNLVGDAYRTVTKSALMGGFHRPTSDEFRLEFIAQCRMYLRRKGIM